MKYFEYEPSQTGALPLASTKTVDRLTAYVTPSFMDSTGWDEHEVWGVGRSKKKGIRSIKRKYIRGMQQGSADLDGGDETR